MREGADDAELEAIIRDAVWRKELKHHVGEPGFIQPAPQHVRHRRLIRRSPRSSRRSSVRGSQALAAASSGAAMLLLMLFALIAGAGTAITPCVLPVVPALLSASALGGRRRPLGIVLGLALTFTIAIVALAQLVKGVGLASGAARTLAIVVLLAFGVVLLIPELAERVQAPLSRLARFGPRTRGIGVLVRASASAARSGFVCAPCAGPILAAVTSVSASSGASARVVAVALAYAVGLSAVMLLYGLGGRAVLDRVRRRSPRPQRSSARWAWCCSLTGVVMATNLDVRFEEALAKDTSLPAIFVDPTRALENSSAVQNRLASLRPPLALRPAPEPRPRATPVASEAGVAIPASRRHRCPSSDPPPTSPTPSAGSTPRADARSRLAGLRGHVVLVDFWTYTCINCIRTLPFLKGLYATYHRYGLEIVGVETPEFTFEQEAGNVAAGDRLRRPALPGRPGQRYGTWNAYQNEYWPAEYLIDAHGQVRHTQFGEGNYKADEAAVRELLYEAGARQPAAADDRARDAPLQPARHARDLPRRPARPGLRAAAAARDPRLRRGQLAAAERVRPAAAPGR